MADIYLVGHGAWDTIGQSEAYCIVPKNTEVVFYTPVGRFLNSDQTGEIVSGAPGRLRPDHTVGAFKTCTNLTLSNGLFPEEQLALTASGVRYHEVFVNTSLKDLLTQFAGNRLHWLACAVRLGGRDFDNGGTNQDYRPLQGIGTNMDRPPHLR